MASLSGLLALGILSVHLEPGNRGELPFLLPFGMVSGDLNSSTQACAVYLPSHHQNVSSPGSDFISALSMTVPTELLDT